MLRWGSCRGILSWLTKEPGRAEAAGNNAPRSRPNNPSAPTHQPLPSLLPLPQLLTADQVEFWHHPEKAGWMHSQGEHIKTWRKRWFVLKQVRLG